MNPQDMSDDELMKFAGISSDVTDQELMNIAGLKSNLPHSENILQRVAKSIGAMGNSAIQNAGAQGTMGMSVNPKFPFLPQTPMDNPMMTAGMNEAQMPITKGNPIAQAGMSLTSNLLAGGKLAGGTIAKNTGEGIRNIKNPSKVFGEKIGSLQSASPNSKVNFFDVIHSLGDDPMAKKVIEKSGVIQKYGGSSMKDGGAISENLSNLSLQDSQDFVNMLKSSVRQAVKEGVVKPTEIGISKLFSGLVREQDKVFEGFKGARKAYGFGKNFGKAVKKTKNAAVTGAAIGAGGTAAGTMVHSLMK